jgi:hypothetical protein
MTLGLSQKVKAGKSSWETLFLWKPGQLNAYQSHPYYGVGDDAFVNYTTLLSPYGGTHLDM